jgi:Flp pilus assembly protein TadG
MKFTLPVKRFADDKRGAVAIMFALALLPLTLGVGAAVDYSRASLVRADLQSATDAAILSIGRSAIETGSTDVTAEARKAFDAGFKRTDGTTVTSFTVVRSGATLTVEVDARVPLAFAGILKQDGLTMKAKAEVQLGTTDIEVALVVDNTGSMAEAGKMTELKRAAKGLIDRLQSAATTATTTSVKIAIVPFDTQIRIGGTTPLNPPPSWVRLLDTGGDDDDDDDDEQWRGCIIDRDQPYDAQGTLPSGLSATKYPGTYDSCSGLQRIMTLRNDYATLRTHIDGMQPHGYTNTTIGLAWGLNVLTPGAPMSSTAEAPRPNLRKHIVFLTDGENTRNRWTTNQAQIDARTALLCNHIKTTTAITLHTIRLVEGNETLLKNCASDPLLYHSVTNATDLTPIFDKVAKQLIAMRIAR